MRFQRRSLIRVERTEGVRLDQLSELVVFAHDAVCNPSFNRNQTVPDPTFHCAQRFMQRLRDFAVAQPFEIRHLDRFFLRRAQRAHQRTHPFRAALFVERLFIFGNLRDSRNFFGLIFAAPLALAFQSKLIKRAVTRQSQQPGNEWAAARLILPGVAPQVKKNILDNFFRRRALLQNAHNQSVNNPGMAVVELFERTHVFTKKPLHQGGVGRRLAFAILTHYGREKHGLEVSSPDVYTFKL